MFTILIIALLLILISQLNQKRTHTQTHIYGLYIYMYGL